MSASIRDDPLTVPVRRAARAARSLASGRSRLDSVLVYLQGELTAAPAPVLPPGHRIEEMDMEDGVDIERWLAVHNEAFGRGWGHAEYRTGVRDHPHYDIRRTFFLLDPDGPLGTVSIGVFRRNPDMGVGHYIAIAPRGQARGLGKQLAYYRCGAIRELGVTHCEAETQLSRTASLRIWFNCGFEPKDGCESWNTPDPNTGQLLRAVANRRLKRLHRQWKSRRAV